MSAPAHEDGLTSVVIVAADSGPLLSQSVSAALASNARVEIIVVDNASRDGEADRVEREHATDPRVRVLRQSSNIGFGPACNRGAAIARGPTLLFLNPDCLVERDTIGGLRAISDADPTIGVLGVEVLSPDGAPARGNRRSEPSLRRALMSMSGLSRWRSRFPSLGGVESIATPADARIERVDAVSGACLFLTRRAFDAVAGFDEAYFLHVEDLDLCRRVRDAGFVVAIAPQLHATHAQGTSSRHRPVFVSRHKHRGMWRYFARFDPAARNPVVRGIVWLGIWAHFAITAPLLLARRRAISGSD